MEPEAADEAGEGLRREETAVGDRGAGWRRDSDGGVAVQRAGQRAGPLAGYGRDLKARGRPVGAGDDERRGPHLTEAGWWVGGGGEGGGCDGFVEEPGGVAGGGEG